MDEANAGSIEMRDGYEYADKELKRDQHRIALQRHTRDADYAAPRTRSRRA
jgi:hypothetical protein